MKPLVHAFTLFSSILLVSSTAKVPTSGANRSGHRFASSGVQTKASPKSGYDVGPYSASYHAPYPTDYASPPPAFALHQVPGVALTKMFGGKVPSFHQIVNKLIFFGGAVSVAVLVLMVLSTIFKFIGWKVPVVANIKDTVLEHVNKLDGRQMEDTFKFVLDAIENLSGFEDSVL